MIRDLKGFLPPPDELADFPPEEIGPMLLKWIASIDDWNGKFYPGSMLSANFLIPYCGREKLAHITEILSEGWVWLDNEGMFVPEDWHNGWVRISRRGHQFLKEIEKEPGKVFQANKILPKDSLDPVLRTKVWPTFLRGDFDTAVFAAMKEVEVRVRETGKFSNDDYGIELMRKAFHADMGSLSDKDAVKSEREALAHLFAGAIGIFKNPGSHRNVNFEDPHRAAEAILFANLLLKIIDERSR